MKMSFDYILMPPNCRSIAVLMDAPGGLGCCASVRGIPAGISRWNKRSWLLQAGIYLDAFRGRVPWVLTIRENRVNDKYRNYS